MKRYFALLTTVLVIGLPAKAQEPLTPEVNRMIEYLMLADEAGLNVPLYIMELSDQLAMLSLTNRMNKEIMEQGAAAAELYAHPLVCMNYAACLMKQQKYGSALHYLNKAWKQDNKNVMLAIDPDYGLALQLKATLLLKKGDQESQLQAVDYVLRSALDVWNGISVRQFNSLIAQMQQLYYYYLENKASIPDNFKRLPTPLDGKERYFRQIIRAGRDWADEPTDDKFPYPVDPGTLEFEGEEGWEGLLDADNAFAEKAQSIKIPIETSEYPAEYTGMTGGDTYQPDSRAFHMTLLAYFYHQIKLLEASYKAEIKELKETEPYEKRYHEAQEALWAAMEEEHERKLKQGVVDLTLIKKYGEKAYLVGKEYVNASVRIHLANWEHLMRPALEAYAKDIKTGLIYIGNDVGFAYIQSRFDKDIATLYEYNELSYLATMQGDVNLEHGGASLGEEILAELREREQEYQDYLTRTRNRRYLEWDSNEKLRTLIDVARALEGKTFARLLLAFFLLMSVSSLFTTGDPFVLKNGYSFAWLLVVYLFGAYWRLHIAKPPSLALCLTVLGVFSFSFLIPSVGKRVFSGELGIWFGNVNPVRYTSPFTLGMTLAIFGICKHVNVRNGIIRRMLVSMSKKSLGMYLWLVHPVFWYSVWRPRLGAVSIRGLGDLAAYALLITLCSFLSAWLLECVRQRAFSCIGRLWTASSRETEQRSER